MGIRSSFISRGRPGVPAPSIAIDLDGVLTEHPRPLAAAASAQFGLDLPERAFIDSAGLNVPQAVRDWVYGDEGPASQLGPAPEAREFLDRLIALLGIGNVRIVTARSALSSQMTLDWLKRYDFAEVEVRFADDKATLAASCGCTFAVEDSLRHARNYAASGITCFLLAIDGTTPDPIPGIIPVNSLMEVVSLLAEELDRRRTLSPDGLDTPPPPKIVVADAIHPAAREHLAEHAEIIDVDGTDVPALLAAIAQADALIVRSETQVTAEVIAAAPHLRVVARAGVGVDNIDLDAATRAGVLVLNAPGANRFSAGEHTIALLLAVTRQLVFANESTHAGRWERKKIKPIDLRGRTAGIVGLGRVGSVVAQRLAAFEMNLIAYDPYVTEDRFAELGVRPVDYDELLRETDVVTYHVPSTAETHHMLNAARIELLKPGAIVLNCARGEVVDEVALADALGRGRILGAGVDVFPHEPCTSSPLFGLPNVVLTPHTGGSSAEALAAVGEMISTSVLAALAGQAVPNAVNLPPASLLAPELQRLTTVAGAAGHLLAVLEPVPTAAFRVTVNGSVPEDVTEHVTSAALSEALNRWTTRRVTPVNAHLIAAELGMEVRVNAGTRDPNVEPSFSFETSGEPSHQVRVFWDRKQAGIVAVDRFALDRPLVGEVMITHHQDVPGVIGRVGTILGRYDVNIAGMEVGRHHPGGEAIMVVNVDEEIPDGALDEIRSIPGLERVYKVSLPLAQPRTAMAATPVLAAV
ncbi:MAG TPA: phosphoglycerate dehydrogenase [Thermomicrobiales bacterium]|nr:phosphoglycerate dehydrogenase [Thermomicrobiales bacterium]